ncbi:hypothetical protein VKT23_019282 [Stygiomarasmius scandens]|uniref:F-box domain-containing protein n=1 Tax=Marasmiellus scandens TaxID=2682957 RepID=A0ABR1IPW3_9AGAR
MHPVLLIPEILHHIASFNDPATNAIAAQTCRFWSEICLPFAWEVVDDENRLLCLCRPFMSENRDSISPTILLHGWDRFRRYASWARELHFNADSKEPLEIIQLSIFKPANCFPRLRTLRWIGEDDDESLDCCVAFMQDSLERFELRLGPYCSWDKANLVLSMLPVKVPGLQVLVLEVDPWWNEIEMTNDVVKTWEALIASLPCLREISVPSFPLMERVVAALSLRPAFEKMSFVPQLDTVVLRFKPVLEGGFSSLQHLMLGPVDFILVLPFLSDPLLRPVLLRSLHLTSPDAEDNEIIYDLFTTISSKFPHLEELSILCASFHAEDENDEPLDTVKFKHITPLLACRSMKKFCFRHPAALLISNAEYLQLATSWPLIQTLILNHTPYYLYYSNIPIYTDAFKRGLSTLLSTCRCLEVLGLYMDTDNVPVTFVLPEVDRKSSLRKLYVGNSVVEDSGCLMVAKNLSNLLPLNCEVLPRDSSSDHDNFNVYLEPQVAEWVDEYDEKWSEVAKALSKVRKEKRESDCSISE